MEFLLGLLGNFLGDCKLRVFLYTGTKQDVNDYGQLLEAIKHLKASPNLPTCGL